MNKMGEEKKEEMKTVEETKVDVKPSEEEMYATENGKLNGSELHAMKAGLVEGAKRKVAMLVAYCGEDYHGLQMNRKDRSLKTIEREFFTALAKSKLVLPNCSIDPSKMGYKCASRTDKGVSTCGQVLSMKVNFADNCSQLINEHLPDDIKVLSVKRTTKKFSSHHKATGRTYTYTCPTFAFTKDVDISYRITPEKLSEVEEVMKRYIGTHSFHNFTSGKTIDDASAKRFIMSFTLEEPFIHKDMQFITFRLKGQSFMIHQIRKMMGLIISIVSGHADVEHMERAFTHARADVPIAPGHGLVLEQVHYANYNEQYADTYGSLDFDECSDARKDFLRNRIMPSIYKHELNADSMKNWLETLTLHDFTEKGGYRERLKLPKRPREESGEGEAETTDETATKRPKVEQVTEESKTEETKEESKTEETKEESKTEDAKEESKTEETKEES